MSRKVISILVLFVAIFTYSCKEDPIIDKLDPDVNTDTGGGSAVDIDLTTQLVTIFAQGTLDDYYLWVDDEGRKELIEAVLNPDTCRHPEAAIKQVLNKEDRWTKLYDNMTEILEGNKGIETSFGMELIPYLLQKGSNKVIFVVVAVYAGGPAEEAGIKRGDIINKMDDEYITTTNYQMYYDATFATKFGFAEINATGDYVELDKSIRLTPVKMYENPVVATEVFSIGSKKVGYLAYTAFTDSVAPFERACEWFKNEGVSELVLDLRYNGGGLAKTCNAVASLLAPKSAVENQEVFNLNIYNKALTPIFEKLDLIEEKYDKKYAEHNLDLSKLYVLTTGNTASASESVIVGLSAYMDVTLIGDTTYGKFCTGNFLTPDNIFVEDFYNKYKDYFKDWGIYVMIGTFSDKNGRNDSRPNGFVPNYAVKDKPIDGLQLGDPNEALLHKALELAGMQFEETPTRASSRVYPDYQSLPIDRPRYNFKELSADILPKIK